MTAGPLSPARYLNTYPQAFTFVNGIFIPTSSFSVEQSAYGNADTATVNTYLYDLGTNLGALSQQQKYVPMWIMVGNSSLNEGQSNQQQLYYGFLEELEADWDTDNYSIHSRGLLAYLIDNRISQRVEMNVDVTDVMRQLVNMYGYGASLVLPAGLSGVKAGSILTSDYVAISRNVRCYDLMQTLAQGIGWVIRVHGTSIIFGPPPIVATTVAATTAAQQQNVETVPIFYKEWQNGAGMKLNVRHNALHSHNIKVKVISYIPGSKGAVSASSQETQLAATLGLPAPTTTTTATPSGRQSGTTSVGDGATNDEEYVFHYPGLTAAQAQQMADMIRDEISRHEFIATLTFTPSADELSQLVSVSPEFALQLTGNSLHQQNHDQLYYPRKVTWNYDVGSGLDTGSGLTVEIMMVNHVIPVPTGAQ